MKRKATKPKKAADILKSRLPEMTKEEKERQEAKKVTAPKVSRQLKNIHSTRVVVKDAPSGQRYDFGPGEQQPVNSTDADHLLSLKRKGSRGCCGGAGSIEANYNFEEV